MSIFLVLIFSMQIVWAKKSAYEKNLKCYAVFLQTAELKSAWIKAKEWARAYKGEYVEHGPKRFFVKPTGGNTDHLVENRFWFFYDPSYESMAFIMRPGRTVIQYIPRKLSLKFAGIPREFSPYRRLIDRIDDWLAPKGYQLSIPSNIVLEAPLAMGFFFTGLMGAKKAGQYFADKEILVRAEDHLNNDVRYGSIKRKLDNGEMTKEEAVTKAQELMLAYSSYIKQMGQFMLNEKLDITDPEITVSFLLNEENRKLYFPILGRVYGYINPSFYKSRYLFENDIEEVNFAHIHEIFVLSHKKILTQQAVYSYLLHRESENVTRMEGFLDQVFADEYFQKLKSFQVKGMTNQQLAYYILQDLDDQARFDEAEILGVQYKHPNKPGEVLGLKDLRVETLSVLATKFP